MATRPLAFLFGLTIMLSRHQGSKRRSSTAGRPRCDGKKGIEIVSMRTRLRVELGLILALLIMIVIVGVAAASPVPPLDAAAAGESEIDLMRWAITQGGLTLALIVVLWSYRRDLRRDAEEKHVQLAVLVALVRESTAANEKSAAASEANEKAVHRLARALETMEKRIEG